ncbi:trypsin-like peptidase domain-containing protein [Streptomyces sp. NPDC046831]|uniref:effector-associated domain 2-containing protein n=1 Tax=Streptomyces sp. NPDC046831 TaxID=3154805 RepID=UPI00340C88AF
MAVVNGDTAGAPALGRVRVLSPHGAVVGAGLLVMPGTVLTCAHVVAWAAGPGTDRTAVPAGPVLVDTPAHPEVAPGTAFVAPGGWFPGPLSGGTEGDFAVLRTDWAPAGGPAPARLGSCGEPDRREVSMYGHPASAPAGLLVTARLAGRGGPHPDWVQLDGLGPTGAWISQGFSGAGVWDPAARRVVGVVTAVYTEAQAKVGWMLPLEAVAARWPELGPRLERPARVAPQRPPEPPPDRDQFALADALLSVPQIEEDGGAALRRLLPARIRHTIRTSARPRLQLFYVVQACADHRDGRQALLDAVRLLDDESRPARAALGLLERLWPVPAESETS